MVGKFLYEHITGNRSPQVHFSTEDESFYSGKRVLITGAGGSIGSQIAYNLSKVKGIQLDLMDRDENALHSLSLSLTDSALFELPNSVLADIRDSKRITKHFRERKPDFVIHCAALKHLSILERYPREAVLTNVIGTQNLLNASKENEVSYFLNISTDKAVYPVSMLGKTKRIAELLVIGMRSTGYQGYTSVRFGNVFNSKGSVIETFAHQMRNGVPITLTSAEVTRFFMHVDEAAVLALKALVINQEPIHILDMGEPVLLRDVIDRMQEQLSTSSPISITGMRPGEKLNESLIGASESSTHTSHSKIQAIRIGTQGIQGIDLDIPESDDEATRLVNKWISAFS
jgi:FlaA1/EpsC-like NDP-sugar epimerase